MWRKALAENKIALGNPRGLEYLGSFDVSRKPGGLVAKELRISLGKEGHPDEKTRHKAMQNLAAFTGNASHGKEVFARMCIACHRIHKEGAEFGPELTQVATRLNRFDLVESIIDPSAKIDPKFSTTSIQTTNGRVLTGFADSEDVETITLRYAAGDGIKTEKIKKSEIKKRQMVRSSNMPEGLAETMSPQEFTDLVEFLAALK